jgi:hypothetical protein
MRFRCGADVRVHLACAAVRKHLLVEARQRSRDKSTPLICPTLLSEIWSEDLRQNHAAKTN